MSKEFINPVEITKDHLPCIVFSSHDTDSTSWLIRWFTSSSYNHVMIMRQPLLVCTQGWGFNEIPISIYMKKGCRLKFWHFPEMTNNQKTELFQTLQHRLDLPKWRQGYDFIGLLGQALNIRWINFPQWAYCSEQVAEDWSKAHKNIPGKPSPEEINALLKTWDDAKVLGYWQYD